MLSPEMFRDKPLKNFLSWLEDARSAGEPLPEAAALATSTPDGYPSVRMVLYKGFLGEDFAIYTNYDSRKGRELLANPRAALVFHWPLLKRQVRVEGVATKTSREESEHYFHSRPRGSQIGAWVSHQDEEIPGREFLEARYAEFEKKFEGADVPLPPYWGGFKLHLESIEFWEERESRLHDRIFCMRTRTGWSTKRLAP